MNNNHTLANSYLSPSKVSPPLINERQEVLRGSLVESLVKSPAARKVTLLQAPAGYGKSTIMRQIMAHYQKNSSATVWVNFDSGDNDVSRFLSAFGLAVSPYTEKLSDFTKQNIRNNELAHTILDTLNNMPRGTAIFFDNLETIRNPAVSGLITRGIETLSNNCQIFLGSRVKPSVGLSRLKANDQLTTVDFSELCFDESETADFIQQESKKQLPEDQLNKLYGHTQGWPAILKLAACALEGKSDISSYISGFSGSNASIASYLAEEVLDLQTEETQNFLLQSSVFEEIEAEISNKVLQIDNSLQILLDLQERNLFVSSAQEQANIFRFHALFRDFLKTQLERRNPSIIKSLHERASKVYIEHDRPIPAIQHALLSDNEDIGIQLLKKHAEKLINQGRIRLLSRLIGQIPKQKLSQHIHLKLIYALCITYTQGPHLAYNLVQDIDKQSLNPESEAYLQALQTMQLAMMDRIEEAHSKGIEALPLLPPEMENAKATLYQALTRTSIILGEHKQAQTLCDDVRGQMTSSTAFFNILLAESAESTMDLMRGQLIEAYSRLSITLNKKKENVSSDDLTLINIQMAEVLYEKNMYTDAKKLLTTNSALVQDMGPADTLINSAVILSRIVEFEGDQEHALQLLIELENCGHRLKLPRVVASARLECSRLWIKQGNLAAAQKHLNLAKSTYDWKHAENLWYAANDTLIPSIIEFQILIREGKFSKAIPSIRKALRTAERNQRHRRALKLRIILAEAQFLNGDRNSAKRTMTQALIFARQEGFRSIFLEEGSSLDALCQDMGGSLLSILNEAILDNQEQHQTKTPSKNINLLEGEQLTEKEIEVLHILAKGLSNQDMADQLFVSESTVRTHLRNINQKLHAKSRTEAVSKARNIGLII